MPRSSRTSLDRVRALCLALPEAHEVEAWGEPTFRVKNKLFAMYADAGNHHGKGIAGVWVKATRVNQDLFGVDQQMRHYTLGVDKLEQPIGDPGRKVQHRLGAH